MIKTTPFAALDPYMADADASLRTSMDSMSSGLRAVSDPPGRPSITTRTALLALIDPAPLIFISIAPPGAESL